MTFRNPFKGHAPKKTAISITAGREFEREVNKLVMLEGQARKIYKDSKRGSEAQTAQSKFEVKMTECLVRSDLCQEDETSRQLVEDWNASVLRLDLLSSELNTNAYKTVIEPLKKFTNVFPGVHDAVKKRNQSLQAYTNVQQKHEKLQKKERTGHNVVKLDEYRRAMLIVEDDFMKQNKSLLENLPKLYEGRIEYVQPSLEALIRAKVNYYTEAHNVYRDLSAQVNSYDGVNNDQTIEQKLAEIRTLSITADD